MNFPKPLFVTPETVDPWFGEAFVDVDEECRDPVPHRYVSGGFAGIKARFSFYYTERSHHENPMTAAARTQVVSYGGALQQALRDLAAWVEEGKHPLDTAYRVEDSQVILPASAAVRKGIQPVIAPSANGGLCAEVRVGEAVDFAAMIEAPPGAGKIVAAEWDFEGSGLFADFADLAAPAEAVTLSASHAYAETGTWFAVLRATLQREGDAATPYGRVQNLARVRVVVT